MREHSNKSPVDHVGLEELKVVHIFILSLKLTQLPNLMHLRHHNRALTVTLAVDLAGPRIGHLK